MNKYELTVILKPNLEEELQKSEIEKIHGTINRFNGTIDKVDELGKRRLAYPISKYSEGIYSFTNFSATADAPIEIENRIRIMENVLRFLIVRVDEK